MRIAVAHDVDVGYHGPISGSLPKKTGACQFYFEESRQHILWTIQLRPVRKGRTEAT